MLEHLDTVDWTSLTHAYGEATDVPGLLRSLLSADPKLREEAIYDLHGNIWHQGTVYPASAVAVPFVYELLTAPDVQDKASIAHPLACIAAGVGSFEVHAVVRSGEPTRRGILGEKGKSLEDELAREAEEIRAVRRAASPGLLHLLPYLTDGEAEVRYSVAAALGNYPEHAAWSLPALESALASEDNKEVRKALVRSKARLTRDPADPPAAGR